MYYRIHTFSCNEKEEFVTEQLNEYIPLQVGKYITYRIDSLVFTNFGRTIETRRYQVKEQVDAQITDNLGRPSFRIYRYLRDSLERYSGNRQALILLHPYQTR